MARFVLDPADIRRASREAARSEIAIGARQISNRAKVLAPVDTGRLRSSIRYTLGTTMGNPSARVFTNVDYAPYVHDGTRPHIIRPRRSRVLRFEVGGQVVYARRVRHPGTRSRPFLTDALAQVSRQRGWDLRRDGID